MPLQRWLNVWRAHRSALRFRALAAMVVAVAGAGFLACGGPGSDSTGPGAGSSGGAATVVITPSAPAVSVGGQVSLTAQVLDASGGTVGGATVFWSSADTTIATVTSSGVVTGKAVGSTQIAASSGGKSSAAVVTVSPVPVASLAVLPSAVTLMIGGSVTLAAVASDANGNTLTGRSVTWASSAPAVATVDGTGKVTGVTAGTATVSATCEGKVASATVTITVIPVAAVSIVPGSAALNVGQSTSLNAVTTDANGNVLGGRPVTWTTANAAVATVSNAGLVSAIAAGTTTITATAEGKSNTAQVVVTSVAPPPPIPVASVSVAPGAPSLSLTGTVTLSATVRDVNGVALTGRVVTWSTSASGVATVSTSGVVTAVTAGSATITATSEGKSGTAIVTVVAPTDPVDTVIVTPISASLVQDSGTTFIATVRNHAGMVLTGRTITWASSVVTVANVAPVGPSTLVVATDSGVGNTAITATSEGKIGAAVVTVTPRPVATIAVSPSAVTIVAGNTAALVDTTRDAHSRLLTGRTVRWSSSDTGISTVSGSGVVKGVAPGIDTVTATSEGQHGTSVITVLPVPVASVSVSPSAASITAGNSVTVTATPRDARNDSLSGRTVMWTSSAPRVASVPATGLTVSVTGDSAGTDSIIATSEGKHSAPIVVTVTPAPVASVSVSSDSTTLTVGHQAHMSSIEKAANGSTLTGRVVRWSSGTPTIATVDSISGLVTALDSGTVSITATSETITGSASITVHLVPVASVTLTATPDSAITLSAGTVTVTAQALDASSNQLSGRTYTWTSSAPTIATVTASGASVTVTGAAGGVNGTVTITVLCGGVQNTVMIIVSGQ